MNFTALGSSRRQRGGLLLLSVLMTLLPQATAFLAAPSAFLTSPPSRSHSSYQHTDSKECKRLLLSLLRAAPSHGAGLPPVPSGDFSVFDPNEEGKMGDTTERISAGVDYHPPPTYLPAQPAAMGAAVATAAAPVSAELEECQHWLEDLGVPAPFAKASAPVTATVLGRTKVIDETAPGDIEHVLMQLPEGMHYVEGQSLSVIPPGVNDKGKPHKPRLYSIASTRYGDLLDGRTVSLCVRRAEYTDPATGLVEPSKAGVCSNYLCDIQAGETVQVAGPVGKTMLLPEDPTKDIIMVGTGTGIAPFRGFLHRLFMENTVARHLFQGEAWLILGVPVSGGLLYQEEWNAMMSLQQQAQATGSLSSSLRIDYAISREMVNLQGGKLYVQDVLAQNADTLLDKLERGAHIYFCGLKGMMPGILDALEQVAASRGMDWTQRLKELQKNNQWHVEVY